MYIYISKLSEDFFYSWNKYFMSTYCVSNNILGLNKTIKCPFPQYNLGIIDNEQKSVL